MKRFIVQRRGTADRLDIIDSTDSFMDYLAVNKRDGQFIVLKKDDLFANYKFIKYID